MNMTINYTQIYNNVTSALYTGLTNNIQYMNNILFPYMNNVLLTSINMTRCFLDNFFNIPHHQELEIYITFAVFSLLFFLIMILTSERSYFEEYEETMQRLRKYKKAFSSLQKRYETLLSEVKSYRGMMKNYLNIRDENDMLKSSGLNRKLLETILNLSKTQDITNMSTIVNIIERELNPVGKKRPRRMASPLYFESS